MQILCLYSKKTNLNKENYRPVNCLPAGSKVFERILHKQISSYIEFYWSPYLCGYRKGYCAQYAIITLLENWKTALDEKGYGGAILMGLYKAFDTLNRELLIAKLNAYGFSHYSLRLLYSYLSNRWQRKKINNTFTSLSEKLLGVPQGTIFYIYLNDRFFINIESDQCNFADENTLHLCGWSLDALVHKLEASAKSVIKWFDYNYMKLNEPKCKLLISGNKEEVIIATVGRTKIIESHEVTLLGCHIVILIGKVKLNDHATNT